LNGVFEISFLSFSFHKMGLFGLGTGKNSKDVEVANENAGFDLDQHHEELKKKKKTFLNKWESPVTNPDEPILIDHFNRIRTLGTGSFGRVMLGLGTKSN